MHVIVEAYQQALHEVDILLRNDYAEGVGAEHEDQHCEKRTAEHRLRIVDRRIGNVAHVHARHLHAGIEQEDRGGKNHVVEIGEVREEVAVEIQLRHSAGAEIYRCTHHEEYSRYDRTDHTADLRYLADPAETFERYQRGDPVDSENHHEGVDLVSRQM